MAALTTNIAGDQQRTPLVLYTVPERDLSLGIMAFVVVGLLFMIVPGTLMGVLNLIHISAQRAALDPAYIQAHGHAQIFGWIGSFILGIGYFSLPKVRRQRWFGLDESWFTLGLWTAGNMLRWATNMYQWQWQWMLPLSAALELAAFLIFFRAVAGHRAPSAPGTSRAPEAWMLVVIAGTLGLLTALILNLMESWHQARLAVTPAFPASFEAPFLALTTWGFLVLFVWGFSARWMPVFMGLKEPNEKLLLTAVGVDAVALLLWFMGHVESAAIILLAAAVLASVANRMFAPADRPAKTRNVDPRYPAFVRIAYGWSIVAAALGIWAAYNDQHHGIWGASRHALTVGFLATMVVVVGQRVLPHFAGLRPLFSSRIMLASMVLLNIGCLLRVTAQIAAYEHNFEHAWHVLPVSAILEITALFLFALNLGISFALRAPAPAKLPGQNRAAQEM